MRDFFSGDRKFHTRFLRFALFTLMTFSYFFTSIGVVDGCDYVSGDCK